MVNDIVGFAVPLYSTKSPFAAPPIEKGGEGCASPPFSIGFAIGSMRADDPLVRARPEMVDLGFGQGRSDLETDGVAV
jgi:hypothetical protein